MPQPVSGESQDRPFADIARGAKADLQFASSFYLNWLAPVQRLQSHDFEQRLTPKDGLQSLPRYLHRSGTPRMTDGHEWQVTGWPIAACHVLRRPAYHAPDGYPSMKLLRRLREGVSLVAGQNYAIAPAVFRCVKGRVGRRQVGFTLLCS